MTMTHPALTLEATYEDIRRIGPWLAGQIEPIDAGAFVDRVGELELAVHELATNIIDHAFDDETRPGATFDIVMRPDGNDLVVTFEDRGRAYDTSDKPVIGDEPTVRGYGLFIVEQLASSVNYERLNDRNRWTLVFSA